MLWIKGKDILFIFNTHIDVLTIISKLTFPGVTRTLNDKIETG